MSINLSIIVPTVGRDHLCRTLDSIIRQMRPGDELLVDYNDDSFGGNVARNRMISAARSTNYLTFMDDDDRYTPGSFDLIRNACWRHPYKLHIWQMRYLSDQRVLWNTPSVSFGNVGTPMFVIRAQVAQDLGAWFGPADDDQHVGGDHAFAQRLVNKGVPVAWHEHVIAEIGNH